MVQGIPAQISWGCTPHVSYVSLLLLLLLLLLPPSPPPLLLVHLCPKDLCVLSRGEQGQWIKRTSVSATLGLELVEQVWISIGGDTGCVACAEVDAMLAPPSVWRPCTATTLAYLDTSRLNGTSVY